MVANVRTKYEADAGQIHAIVLKPPTAAVAGAAPAAAVNQNIKVQVNKSTRSYGLKPRGVTLSRTLGTAPDTFTTRRFLPCLTPAAFASPAFALGAAVTISAVAWVIVGRRAEDYN